MRKKILIVDDDPMLSDLAATLLGEFYEVAIAADGQEGYEKALAFRPDVVITDLMMPRMHGYELCQRLKSEKKLPGVKVLIASSKAFASDINETQAAGADAYIIKPYHNFDLLETVQMLAGDKPPPPAEDRRSETAAGPAALAAPAGESPAPASVTVRFWGTRGSCPVPGAGTARYGGNTACTEIRIGDTPVILDCGTGIRALGLALQREFRDKPINGHIFVGHTHWDHIQGFPFFTPFYSRRNSFRIYSVRGSHNSLEGVFSGAMASDYFPVPLNKLACRLEFIEMRGPVELPGGVKIFFHHLNHPGVAIGFRIEACGKVVTYLSDHESFIKLHGDNDISRRDNAEISAFVKGSDLLIGEAQYTEEEYAARRGWGHSTYDDMVKCALDAGAKRLAVFHHDPDRTDEMLDANIEHCRGLVRSAGASLACFAAQEGQALEL